MAAKKRGLGERGLGALLAGSKVNLDQELKDHDGELREVPIDLIQRGRYQPRRDMDPAALQELADSIRQQGVMQPVVVRSRTSSVKISIRSKKPSPSSACRMSLV